MKPKQPIEQIHPRSLKFLSKKLYHLVEGKLWLKVLIGLFFGALVGLILGPDAALVSPDTASLIAEWLSLPGILFLKIIQMVVIPLIFASIIMGIAASESMKQLKKTGFLLAIYFILTTLIAIVIGTLVAQWIQPGAYVDLTTLQQTMGVENLHVDPPNFSMPTLKELPTAIVSLLPANLFNSILNGEMLQIVIFSLIFGIALINVNVKQSKPLLELLGSLQNVCMTIIKWAMLLAPLAVFGLIAKLTSQIGINTFVGIGMYVLAVLIGLSLLMVFYCLIAFLATRQSPLVFLSRIRDVQLLAFSTSSSAAVMPLSIKTAEEQLNVRPSLSQFVIPMGATINMDGTALYQAIATIFLAQLFHINLSATALLFLLFTIVAASIGSPGTPGVGIAILSTILTNFGIPLVGVALIIGVDRILDMCRTAVNVTGDLTACLFLNTAVGGTKTTSAMLKDELKHEKRRKVTGEHITIVNSH